MKNNNQCAYYLCVFSHFKSMNLIKLLRFDFNKNAK